MQLLAAMPRPRSGPRMYRRKGRKVWYASLDDKHKHISLGTEDETEAGIEFARLLERSRVLQLAPSEVPLTEIFAEVRERSLTANTPKTIYGLHLNLRRILKFLEGRDIHRGRDIDKQVVEDFKSARRFEGAGNARINRELDSWRRAHRVVIEKKCAPAIPLADLFEKLREPRPNPHRKVHTATQLKKFVTAAPTPYRSLFRAALGSGLRRSELMHIGPEDVHKREVWVGPKPPGACPCCPRGWTTKSFHQRRVPISSATRKALLDWISRRESGEVNADEKKVWKVAQAVAVEAKVPPITLHGLRHAWASHLYHRGVPIKTLSMWLGHRDVATTERYLGVVDSSLPKGTKLPW